MITVKIDAAEKHEISPYLYMQFMEPLGVCDSSVDAAWDFVESDWYPSVIEKVRELAPTMIRFGGCFASYYHWREAIGKQADRKPMLNYCWSGIYPNQVGTHEIVDFCRRVNAEPLLVVNMESDGRMHWAHPKNGTDRFGTAEEAADWVSYCNGANNAERIKNGIQAPYNVKYWQIGNETSYDVRGYGSEKTVEVTKRFIEAMRRSDPTLKLIGWGDNHKTDNTWCRRMSELDGLDAIAFHHHFPAETPDAPFNGVDYRKDYSVTWQHLQHAYVSLEKHIAQMRAECGSKRLAMTEGHFVFRGRNRNEVLSSWGSGAAYARCLNVIMRNSDIIDIATMADFFGNVWQVNALMIPTPIHRSEPYLQPVGAVMKLFGKYQGKRAIDVSYSGDIDAVASRTADKIYLHITNTSMSSSQELKLDLGREKVTSVEMHCISASPDTEITPDNTNVFDAVTTKERTDRLLLPPAAVAALEITLNTMN
ncbi:MAG: hypothetical protein IKB34_00240 [Clostridia bacterium]|nr:hypothetical protein [Clostridia bacterium]